MMTPRIHFQMKLVSEMINIFDRRIIFAFSDDGEDVASLMGTAPQKSTNPFGDDDED